MSEEGERTCPLCMEEMDLTDQQLKPCKCGYEICVWCWHHIMEMAEKDDTEGRCPACRMPYDKERIVAMTVSGERLAELNSEKKLKSQKAKSKTSEGRKHLSTARVIQRNLVYIVGIPANLADEETLQRKEFFGQYGKILKVSITRSGGAPQHSSPNISCSVYITYSKNEEAIRCIEAVNGYIVDGRPLRACFGTTKYCHAWLRNMPCGNPDCLYLHDAGTPDDTFIKDEVVSTCASKFQHSPGTNLNHFQRRLGHFLPAPLDDFTIVTKPQAKPSAPTPGCYNKSCPPDGDAGKSCGLPAAASWGSRVTPGKLPVMNTAVIQGTTKHKPSVPNGSAVSSSGVEAQITAQTHDGDQHFDCMVTSRSHTALSNTRLETVSSSKQCNEYRGGISLRKPHTVASVGSMSQAKGTLGEPSCISTNIDRKNGIIPLRCSLASSEFCLPSSAPLHERDATGCSMNCESTKTSSLKPYPANGSMDDVSDCLNIENNNATSRLLDHPGVSPRENPGVSLETLTCPEPEGASISQGVLLSDEQTHKNSGMGMKLLVDLETQSICPASTRPENISKHFMGLLGVDKIVDEVASSSIAGLSLSPKGGTDNLTNQFSGNPEAVKFQNMDHWYQNPTLVDNVGTENSTVCEVNAEGGGENCIIEDILSLDLGVDDPLVSPHNLAKLLLGDSKGKTGDSKLFTPWKSCNNNESRFSFARVDEYNQESDSSFSLSSHGFAQRESSHPQASMVNKRHQTNDFSNGITVGGLGDLEFLDSHQRPSPNVFTALTPVSRSEVSPPPRLPIQRKGLPIPPPGFNPQCAVDRDQSLTMLSSPGSTMKQSFFGISAGLTSPQPMTDCNNRDDIEFIDPAIMAISRGKRPLSMTHLASPSYSSNLLGLSEIDQRLQLLKSRTNNFNQNSMMMMDQSKYNLLQDMALQEAMRGSHGSWGAWNMTTPSAIDSSSLLNRRGQSSLAEIASSGRAGYHDSQYGFLRPLPIQEETKFQMSGPDYFYKTAYDM